MIPTWQHWHPAKREGLREEYSLNNKNVANNIFLTSLCSVSPSCMTPKLGALRSKLTVKLLPLSYLRGGKMSSVESLSEITRPPCKRIWYMRNMFSFFPFFKKVKQATTKSILTLFISISDPTFCFLFLKESCCAIELGVDLPVI